MTAYENDLGEESSVGTKDEELLAEIRANFKSDLAYWADIRAEAAIDMRFLTGDSWDPRERDNRNGTGTNQGRDSEQRLCLNFDELNQNVNQVVNNFLLNKPAVAIDPKGDGANDKTAEFRGDTIRQIEYRSNGTSAYAIAFAEMVRRSYGFFRIVRSYESPKTFNQQLSIKAVPNPDSVLPDPNGIEMDGSDWKRCFVLKPYTHAEFRREWPDATFQSFGEDLIRQHSDWLNEKTVQVAEYWKVKEKRKTLVSLDRPILDENEKPITSFILEDYPGAKIVKDPLQKRTKLLELDVEGQRVIVATVTAQRATITKQVCQYITNGCEILDEVEQSEDCEWIPIIPMYGDEMYVPTGLGPKRVLLSLIRLARDAQTAYSYVRTTQMEVIGQVPKAPYIGYAGQFAGYTDQWDNVNRVRIGYLQVHATTDEVPEGTVLPLPQKTQFEPAIQAMEVSAEALRRAIQSAMGVSPLPTQALRRNEKSGVALKQIESTQQLGSYHFMDHAKLSIAHGGRIMNALLRSTYDTPRQLGLRKADQTFETGPTHQMIEAPPGQYSMNPEVQDGTNIFDVGEHEVTVSTGPSFDSQRQAADDFVDSLVGSPGIVEQAIMNPGGTAAKIFSKAIRLKNLGPIGEEMAEDIDPSQNGEPGQLQAQLQQATGLLQQAQQKIGELQQLANAEATKLKIAELQAQVDLTKDKADNETKIQVALIGAHAKLQDTETAEANENLRQAHREHAAAHGKELDHRVAEMGRKDEMQQAALDRETGVQEADKDRDISVSQADADRKAAQKQALQKTKE